jgi:hypothetical protein
MKKFILSAAAALSLTACGDGGAGEQALHNAVGTAIDEKALVGAVAQSIDTKAVENLARGAVAGAVQEAIPPEVRAVGAVVDEKALMQGLDKAVDGNVLSGAVKGALDGARAAPAN